MPNFTISTSDNDDLSLERNVNLIINKYYPNLLPAVHAALSVVATLSIKDRTKPLSLIFEASSGFGKTAVLQMLFPPSVSDKSDDETKKFKMKIEEYVYRSDKFTPRSFVTHAANVSAKELEKIDLLPKLEVLQIKPLRKTLDAFAYQTIHWTCFNKV